MASESRDERYERQTAEQFAELGRFVQEFEQLVQTIRTCCLFLLPARRSNEQMLVNIFLHHDVMTAKPLFDCMRALYAEVIKQSGIAIIREEADAIRSILRQASTDMEKLIKQRNKLLHAQWHIGWASAQAEDFSELKVFKGKAGRDGFSMDSPLANLDELRELRGKCTELRDLLFLLHATFIVRVFKPKEGTRVLRNFEKIDGRWQRKKSKD